MIDSVLSGRKVNLDTMISKVMEDSEREVIAKSNKTIMPIVGMPYGKMKPSFITRMEKSLSRVIFVAYS